MLEIKKVKNQITNWTTSIGRAFMGVLSKLNKVRETKAVEASRTWSPSPETTKAAKEAKAMVTGAQVQRKVIPAFQIDSFFKCLISFSRMLKICL